MQFQYLITNYIREKHKIEIVIDFLSDTYKIIDHKTDTTIITDRSGLFGEINAFFPINDLNIAGYHSNQPFLTMKGKECLDDYCKWIDEFIKTKPMLTEDFDLNNVCYGC